MTATFTKAAVVDRNIYTLTFYTTLKSRPHKAIKRFLIPVSFFFFFLSFLSAGSVGFFFFLSRSTHPSLCYVIETENRLGGEVRIFFLKKRLKETIIQKKDERGESFLVPEIEVNTMPISIIFFLLLTRLILNVIEFYLFSVDSAIKKKEKSKSKLDFFFLFQNCRRKQHFSRKPETVPSSDLSSESESFKTVLFSWYSCL
jgi:hypothetical protein